MGRERFVAALENALGDDRRLELRASGIGPSAALELTRAIEGSRNQPWFIDLGGNAIGDAGAAHFASLLRRSDSLVWLALGSNGIATGGGIAIATALHTNKSLTALDLSSESNAARRNTVGRRTQAPSTKSSEQQSQQQQHSRPPSAPQHRRAPARAPSPSAAPPPPPPTSHRAAPSLQQYRSEKPPTFKQSGHKNPHRPIAVERVMAKAAQRNRMSPIPPPHDNDYGEYAASPPGSPDRSSSPNLVPHPPGSGPGHAVPEALVALAAALRVNQTLSILKLSGNSLGAEGAVFIAEALEAKTLAPPSADADDDDGSGPPPPPEFIDASYLTELVIAQNSLGGEGMEILATPLATASRLRTVDLSINSIGDRGAKALFSAMAGSKCPSKRAPAWMAPNDVANSICGLVEMILHTNGLTGECAEKIARGVLNRPFLATLRLQHNQLGDMGAEAFAFALRDERCGLTDLNLSDNQISDEGALMLAEAMTLGCKLERLDLSNNQIGEAGGVAFAKALASNKTPLNTFKLVRNKLGEESGVAFAQAISSSSTIRTLCLQHNDMGGRSAEALSIALDGNPQLTQLGTEGNALPYSGMLKLEEVIQRNKRRAKSAAPERAAVRLKELESTHAVLEKKREEYSQVCRQRAAAERRRIVLLSELEDARAKITSSRVYVSNEKENDQERLMGIKRQLTILRKEFEDSKMKWHQVLDGLRKRKASEEVKVRSLNEKFRQEVGEIAAMTRAARESVASMDGRIDAARVRAAEREAYATYLKEELSKEREKVNNRPQLRKQLPPEPPMPSDEEIRSLSLPEGRVPAVPGSNPPPNTVREGE